MVTCNNVIYNVLGFIMLISTPGWASGSKSENKESQSFHFHSDTQQDHISPNFPIRDRDLQQTLRTNLDSIRHEFKEEIDELRTEIRNQISHLELPLHSFIERERQTSISIQEHIGEIKQTIKNSGSLDNQNIQKNIQCQNLNDDHCLLKATTTKEFHNALQSLNRIELPTTIELAEGTYTGEFVVLPSKSNSNTIIKGTGERTIIQLDISGTIFNHKIALNILGHSCTVQNLKLLTDSFISETTGIQINGHSTKITGVELNGFTTALATQTDGNEFTNLTVKNSKYGFHIKSDGNILEDISIQNITNWAIELQGDHNSFNKLRSNMKNFGLISVKGDYNTIQDINSMHSKSGGIDISGRGNLVRNFVSSSFCLYLSPSSGQGMMSNIVCPMVVVQGESHNVSNVDTERLEIFGSGHLIQKSNATLLLDRGSNITFIRSYFNKIE